MPQRRYAYNTYVASLSKLEIDPVVDDRSTRARTHAWAGSCRCVHMCMHVYTCINIYAWARELDRSRSIENSLARFRNLIYLYIAY